MSRAAEASSLPGAPAPDSTPPHRLDWLTWLAAGSLFMEGLDSTIIATALPRIGQSFGHDAVDLNLGITLYLLSVAVCIPASGWVARRYGERWVVMAAIASFTLASLSCGASQTLSQFLASRVLQGASAALMVPVLRLVVLRWTPRVGLMRAIAVLTWPALIAPAIAPALGGYLVDHFNWRWVFMINVPIGVLGTWLACSLVPGGRTGTRAGFDGFGFGLLAAAGALLVLGLEGKPVWLGAAGHLCELATGAACLAGALAWFRVAREPLIDISCLASQSFRTTLTSGSLIRMAIMANPFLLPLTLQMGLGLSASTSGLLLLVASAGNIGIKPLTSGILRKLGFRAVLCGNGLFAALTFAACAWLSPQTPLWSIGLLLIVSGMARSLQFTALNTLAFSEIPASLIASANTLAATTLQFNSGLAVALMAWVVRTHQTSAGALQPRLQDLSVAFIVVAALAATGALSCWRLHPRAGHEVLQRAN